MMTITEFKSSLEKNQPDPMTAAPLKALWYDAKGDWKRAHAQVDQLNDSHSAWVHAYLHRKEGDLFNADYWYRRARKVWPDVSLNEEWEQILEALVGNI